MRVLLSCTAVAALGAAVIGPAAATEARLFRASEQFERVATFVVCENTSCDRIKVPLTAAEIVAASEDGRTLVYTCPRRHAEPAGRGASQRGDRQRDRIAR